MNYIMLDGKKIELSDETAASFRNMNRIAVPDGIEFTKPRNYQSKCSLGLIFNGSKQALIYNHTTEQWIVGTEGIRGGCAPLYLTPCSRSDLKAGDWWTCKPSDLSLMDFNLYLGEGGSAYVIRNGVSVDVFGNAEYYKVTE